MTEQFTFRREVLEKYDEETFQKFMDVFDSMPISALVSGKYLAMHGGIGPSLSKLQDIDSVNRFGETPFEGVFCDLLWADPV
jgi:serine/threonine-protein phosphatase 2B catalytic subunit